MEPDDTRRDATVRELQRRAVGIVGRWRPRGR
jgi:hypothetical protein